MQHNSFFTNLNPYTHFRVTLYLGFKTSPGAKPVGGTHFHMNVFVRRLVLIRRQNATRKMLHCCIQTRQIFKWLQENLKSPTYRPHYLGNPFKVIFGDGAQLSPGLCYHARCVDVFLGGWRYMWGCLGCPREQTPRDRIGCPCIPPPPPNDQCDDPENNPGIILQMMLKWEITSLPFILSRMRVHKMVLKSRFPVRFFPLIQPSHPFFDRKSRSRPLFKDVSALIINLLN